MKIYIRTSSEKNCLSLNELQKCYKKIYKNDCRYCIDSNDSGTTLECKTKNYCDMHLNRRNELIVKKSNINNIIEWIFIILAIFTGIFLICDILYKIETFKPTNNINKFIINNFLGSNFINIIKYIIIITILILFLKILYTSLTDNSVKTSETSEMIYDKNPLS